MNFNIDQKDRDTIAALDESGNRITYGELNDFTGEFYSWIGKRTLIFILCRNQIGALKGYVSALATGIVPLLLEAGMDAGLMGNLIETYRPEYLWLPVDMEEQIGYPSLQSEGEYMLVKTGLKPPCLYEGLGLLLTTSGSTGTAKLVRQSYGNIEANAASIVRYLELDCNERPITNLPMNYTYGLSVINSHLLVGATLLMTVRTVFQKEFWAFFRESGATSIAGVPYTYEMLKKLRFFNMDLPSLRTMTQAGGKLSPELHKEYAEYAKATGRRFYVMYGQTEATARMSYLPYEKSLDKYGSMGIAIPGGRFTLIDAEGQEITDPETVGELVYEGPNVTLGYAKCPEELQKGDERHGRLVTGDMAKFDGEGYFYIVGRKKRFLKLFGKRVNLDECEKLIKDEFGIECACAGRDDLLCVFVVDEEYGKRACGFLAKKLVIHFSAFTSKAIPEIPKNEAGKILYKELSVE